MDPVGGRGLRALWAQVGIHDIMFSFGRIPNWLSSVLTRIFAVNAFDSDNLSNSHGTNGGEDLCTSPTQGNASPFFYTSYNSAAQKECAGLAPAFAHDFASQKCDSFDLESGGSRVARAPRAPKIERGRANLRRLDPAWPAETNRWPEPFACEFGSKRGRPRPPQRRYQSPR